MKMLSLFSGAGMIDLAASWAGIETVAFCEIEEYPQKYCKGGFRVSQFTEMSENSRQKN